jgi:hypothetical protein
LYDQPTCAMIRASDPAGDNRGRGDGHGWDGRGAAGAGG